MGGMDDASRAECTKFASIPGMAFALAATSQNGRDRAGTWMRRERDHVGRGTTDGGRAGDGRGVRVVSGGGSTVIPMPSPALGMRDAANGAAALVAAFVAATAALSADDAARLAGVRGETLRKWRRRPPRWIKAGTAHRLAAHLAGEPPAPPRADDGLRRAFHPRLREVPPE
jgi:hypothetical protein